MIKQMVSKIILALVIFSLGCTNKAQQTKNLAINTLADDFFEWHNATQGSKTQNVTLPDVERFFASDATFIVNDRVEAKSAQAIFEMYKGMDKYETKMFAMLPMTENMVRGDLGIWRYNMKLIEKSGAESIHKIFGYIQVNANNKITRFIELFL